MVTILIFIIFIYQRIVLKLKKKRKETFFFKLNFLNKNRLFIFDPIYRAITERIIIEICDLDERNPDIRDYDGGIYKKDVMYSERQPNP